MRLLLPSPGFYWQELEVLGLFCLEASEYCATKHFVTLAKLLLESSNYRPMVTATTWPSSQFNSVHGPISSSIFCRNSRAHHQAMSVKQGESTRLYTEWNEVRALLFPRASLRASKEKIH